MSTVGYWVPVVYQTVQYFLCFGHPENKFITQQHVFSGCPNTVLSTSMGVLTPDCDAFRDFRDDNVKIAKNLVIMNQ